MKQHRWIFSNVPRVLYHFSLSEMINPRMIPRTVSGSSCQAFTTSFRSSGVSDWCTHLSTLGLHGTVLILFRNCLKLLSAMDYVLSKCSILQELHRYC